MTIFKFNLKNLFRKDKNDEYYITDNYDYENENNNYENDNYENDDYHGIDELISENGDKQSENDDKISEYYDTDSLKLDLEEKENEEYKNFIDMLLQCYDY